MAHKARPPKHYAARIAAPRGHRTRLSVSGLEDSPILVEYLVDRYARQVGKNIRRIAKQTLQLLQAYDWPGNVRELQNVIERAVVLSESETFVIDQSWLTTKRKVTTLVSGEKALIEAALKDSQGRVAGPRGAATKLGIPRQTLEWKIRNLNIDKLAFRRTNE